MKRIRKWLAAVLSAVMLLGLLPATASAAAPAWAQPALEALNKIYGNEFSASEDLMDVTAITGILNVIGYQAVGHGISGTAAENPSGNRPTFELEQEDFKNIEGTNILTRGGAARILTKVYSIDTSSASSPIQYLFNKNIVNGYAGSGELGATDPIDQASFAVLTYRVLNFVGVGEGTKSNLMPGSRDYFCWMYLAARKCVDSEYKGGTFSTDTWEKWETELRKAGKALDPGAAWDYIEDNITAAKSAVSDENGNIKTMNILEAANAVVSQLEKKVGTIFADVKTNDDSSYCYDGVMYLLDNKVISGYGDGRFRPNKELTRVELIQVMGRFDSNLQTQMNQIRERLVAEGHNPNGTDEERNEFWEHYGPEIVNLTSNMRYVDWHTPTQQELGDHGGKIGDVSVTRKELIMGLLNAYVPNKSELNNSNPAILERFTDYDYRNDPAAKALAYAVSRGIVSGTSDTTLAPDAHAARGILAVLLYRVMTGLDTTKMKDYEDNVKYALEGGGSDGGAGAGIQSSNSTTPLGDDAEEGGTVEEQEPKDIPVVNEENSSTGGSDIEDADIPETDEEGEPSPENPPEEDKANQEKDVGEGGFDEEQPSGEFDSETEKEVGPQ